jgi:uncharacterized protein (TIGR03118 family)
MRTGYCLIAVALVQALAAVALADGNAFTVTNLVANSAEYDPQIVDPNMLNAWGIALRPPGAGGHIWVNDDRSGTSVEYIGDVNGIPLHQDGLTVVPVTPPAFADKGFSSVTGIVYNAASDLPGQVVEFPVSGPSNNDSIIPPTAIPGGSSGSAKFVFASKDGTLNAWRTNTADAMTAAPIVVDYSKTSTFPYPAHPVYTGVAMTTNPVTSTNPILGNHLFASDFRNNVIEVFNNQWADVTSTYHFATPATVEDLHPFNVMDLNHHIFVTYAKFNPDADEGFEDTPGFGHVVEYNEDGSLAMDFNSGATDSGILDSPWGMAIAPAGFGKFGGDLLVANFGNDGTIAAFDPNTGKFVDELRDANGDVLTIDGVWGLTFGNGVSLGDANSLYFTAGPDLETGGVLGKITLAPEPTSLGMLAIGAASLLFRKRRPA